MQATQYSSLLRAGYSIFVVLGDLPPCEASDLLRITPAVQRIKPALLGERAKPRPPAPPGGEQSDPDLQRALEESRRLDEEEDESLKRALQQSFIGRCLVKTDGSRFLIGYCAQEL